MGWRSETFLEIQDVLTLALPELATFDLFNNQFVAFDGVNNEHPFDFPNIFLEFAGAEDDWELKKGLYRRVEQYVFRLHVGQANYDDSFREAPDQAQGLAHLDFIDAVINALDGWNGTHVTNLYFKNEEIDSERTEIIDHILVFYGRVTDCSPAQSSSKEEIPIEEIAIKAINNPTIIQEFAYNNPTSISLGNNPYSINLNG